LEGALRQLNGLQHLRVVHTVRWSTVMRAEDRHAVEMELAARLVRVRAVLGKWKSGMKEIGAARAARDAGKLSSVLEKWGFAEDEPLIAQARADLARWQDLATTLPVVLREAIERRDVAQIRTTMCRINASGPQGVEGVDEAKKILVRYDVQARGLNDARASGSAKAIKDALRTWKFDQDDSNVLEARATLQRREDQKAALRAALANLDGAQLQRSVDEWRFEKDDGDFLQARTALQRYMKVAKEVENMAQTPANLQTLGDVVNNWEFAHDDPVLQGARGQIVAFEDTVRAALDAGDIWALERFGTSVRVNRALAAGGLREVVTETLRLYVDKVANLRLVMQGAADLGFGSEACIAEEVQKWPYSAEDPNIQLAHAWLRIHKAVELRSAHKLRMVMEMGDSTALRGVLRHAQGVNATSNEFAAAEAACTAADEAIEAVGAVALGVDLAQLRAEKGRAESLDGVMRTIQATVESVDPKMVLGLKALTKPPKVVHGVLEMLMHVLAGISPHVRNPPRDTDWRACQRMLSNVNTFLANIADVPDWIPSGRMEGIARARATSTALQEELGDQWAFEVIRAKSEVSARLFEYVMHIFAYADLVEGTDDESQNDACSTHSGSLSPSLSATYSWANQQEIPRRLSSRSTVLRQKSEVGRVAQSAPPCHLQLLTSLHCARHGLISNRATAVAWVLSGHDPADLDGGLKKARKYSCYARAVAVVAKQTVAPLLPVPLAPRTNVSKRSLPPNAAAKATELPRMAGTDLSLTLKLLSGEVVAELVINDGCVGRELRARVARLDGNQAHNLRLMIGGTTLAEDVGLGMQGVTDGATLILLRLAPSLSQLVDATAAALSSCSAADLQVVGPHGKPVSEPAAYLVFGPSGDSLSMPPRKGNVQAAMLGALQAVSEILHSVGGAYVPHIDPAALPASLVFCSDAVQLTPNFVKSLRLPQANLAAARRALGKGSGWPVVDQFVEIMQRFYDEFVPLRAACSLAAEEADEAERALRHAEEVVSFASTLTRMDNPPACSSPGDVSQVAATAADQALTLARQGLALPALHIEYVRLAVDSVGAALLSRPPAADPGARMRWSETAMSIQLAPLPHFVAALSSIAESICQADLEAIAQRDEAPCVECQQLILATVWVVESERQSKPRWRDARGILSDAATFLRGMAAWAPVRDSRLPGLTHANEVLLGMWSWVADGCGGSRTLGTLFAWVSLVVALWPMAEMAQRLAPVHKAVKQGIAKSDRAPVEGNAQILAKAKAWTTALFLLDGPGQHWWWLQLIRPASYMEMPWTDGEDGGVGESHATECSSHRSQEGIIEERRAEKHATCGSLATSIDLAEELADMDDDDDMAGCGGESDEDAGADAAVDATDIDAEGQRDNIDLAGCGTGAGDVVMLEEDVATPMGAATPGQHLQDVVDGTDGAEASGEGTVEMA